MKTTWIWFRPDPEEDELAPRYEKLEAIKRCVKKSFPGCEEITKIMSYTWIPEDWMGRRAQPARTGLIFVINHIEGLLAVLYEERTPGSYRLVVDERNRTPVTHYSLDNEKRREIKNMYRLPSYLNIRKYLSRKREVKI